MFRKRVVLTGGDSIRSKRKKVSENEDDNNNSDDNLLNGDQDDVYTSLTVKPSFKKRHVMGSVAVSRRPNKQPKEDEEEQATVKSADSTLKKPARSVFDVSENSESKMTTSQRSTTTTGQNVSTIKTTVFTDYQPDICKDYQQTGYCGYGDSCKFLHSRDDFKAGWKLNQEWRINDDDDNSSSSNSSKRGKKLQSLADIPFKCVICKQDYRSPIMTPCKHYFCRDCFTSRMDKDTKCFICHKETHGVAKVANDLKRYLKEKEERSKDHKQEVTL